jgi:glycosyltransferase involved in cell wall biosynthesis
MIIGIDGSRAFVSQRTGTENYTYHMLQALAEVDKKNQYRIYLKKAQTPQSLRSLTGMRRKQLRKRTSVGPSSRGIATSRASRNPRNDKDFSWPENFQFLEINFPRLFTQAGLALRTWTDRLDLLWVPAHTLPILGNPYLPMLVTIHGIEFQHLPGAYRIGQNLHLTWSTRWAAFRATKIIAVSNHTKKDLINWLHVPPDKVKVIYEGVDINKFKAQRSKRKTTAKNLKVLNKYHINKPYIFFVGTIQPRKNLIRLIEAFSLLLKTYDLRHTTYYLVLSGKLGWDYQEILDAPQEYGVGDRVKFLGYVPDSDLPSLYQHAALYVEPSLQEGFGLPVLEAMASGIPVVAAHSGALPEVAGQAAIFINPHSVVAITKGLALGLGVKINKLGSDVVLPLSYKHLRGRSLISKLVEHGYDQTSKFNWQQAANELVLLFDTLEK